MTTLRTAAQQALDVMSDISSFERWSEAKEALRAALAEPNDPVAYDGWVLREVLFDNGEPVGHREPVQEPVAKVELMTTGGNAGLATRIVEIDDHLRERLRPGQLLYTTPTQRPPLTDEEIYDFFHAARNAKLGASKDNSKHRLSVVEIARAIERAHGIGGQP